MPLKHRLPRLEKLSGYQVAELAGSIRANDIILLIKVIVSLVGKEKAIELITKARWDWYRRAGAERAKQLGNPKDLDAYVKDTLIECNT